LQGDQRIDVIRRSNAKWFDPTEFADVATDFVGTPRVAANDL
jgi:hypothetical protein